MINHCNLTWPALGVVCPAVPMTLCPTNGVTKTRAQPNSLSNEFPHLPQDNITKPSLQRTKNANSYSLINYKGSFVP